MASSDAAFSLFKTLFVPAIISLLIFLALTFVVMPVWRRYRGRYGQYLTLGSLSERTSSLRHRIVGRFAGLAPLATYLGARAVVFPPRALAGAEDADADGEELNDVDEAMWRAIERHVPAARSDSTRWLSRDLEEGFMDDSGDESWPEGPTIIARRGR